MDPLAALLEHSPNPLVVADDSGTVTDANRHAESVLGADAEELAGTSLADLFRVPDADGAENPLRSLPSDEGRRRLRLDATVSGDRTDGAAISVGLTVATPEVGDEQPIVVSLQVDAEDRREDPDPETSEERYRRLVESSPAPIVIYDAEAVIVDANEAAADLLAEADPADVVGTPALEYIHPEERDDSRAGIARVLEHGETLEGLERRLRTADGETRHVVLSSVPATHAGEAAGQVVLSDVTALKVRERELERQNERLDRFASIVSHDLRNPLAVLRSSLEMAAETDDDEEHVARARRATDRMEQLVDGLLTIARHGSTSVDTTQVTLGTVAWAAWSTVGTADAEVTVEAEGTVEAEESRLQELLENLFHNAITHAGDDVTITVGETPEGFFVADDGPGVPPADRDRVFEHGYTTAEDGTGLGLPIVQEIADAHGWDVTLTESDAGGARFEFTCDA